MSKTATFDTAKGTIIAELFDDAAPGTVANFEKLANEKFYDGTRFHRVIKNFMIQGGDPLSKQANNPRAGTGGPGYTHAPQPHLDGVHTVFGQVTSGQDVVNAIAQGDVVNSIRVS
jgi:peptidyl-prolyl cis-trans isomerase B (cyclophilin B)